MASGPGCGEGMDGCDLLIVIVRLCCVQLASGEEMRMRPKTKSSRPPARHEQLQKKSSSNLIW